MPPTEQLAEIRRKVTEMLDVAEKLWLKTLKPELEAKDIKFGRYADLPKKRRTALDRYFDNEIFPILTPQAVDAGHPFPMISQHEYQLRSRTRKVCILTYQGRSALDV